MKKLLLFLALVFVVNFAKAQCYSQISVPYNVIPAVGAVALTGGDDVVSPNIPIGFNFTFYGITYTTCHITTNGWLSFNAGIGATYPGQTLPNSPAASTIIAWAWDDMYTPGGTYQYFVSGVAPNRIFCIDYNNIGYCCTSANQATVQIQLYETTGQINIMSANNNHTGRTSTMGIQSGAQATVVPGRNAASWSSAANEGIGFVLAGAPTLASFAPASACASNGQTVVLTGTNFTGTTSVTIGGGPVASFVVNSATQITATIGANSTGTIAVTNCGGTATSATNFVVNQPPSLSLSASPVNVCAGSSTTIVASGTGTSYLWLPGALSGNTQTFTPVSATTYTVQASDANSCTNVTTITIGVTPLAAQPTAITATPALICNAGTSDLNATGTNAIDNIYWYDALTGGTLVGTALSGANLSVTPAATTTYYAETFSTISGSQSFSYTGSLQTFTVPPGVTSVTLNAAGAQGGAGGSATPGSGGLGAIMTGTFTVTPGQTLKVLVGGQGGGSAATAGAGGGGGTFITDNLNNPLLIAGGGGARHGTLVTVGMDANITTSGSDGYSDVSSPPFPGNDGFGGTLGNGATGSGPHSGNGAGLLTNGAAGACGGSGFSFINLGAGGTSCTANTDVGGYGGGAGGGNNGAGGGGGYSGGGGSYHTPTNGGGAGSFNGGTSQTNSVGNTGNGIALISWNLATCPSTPRVPVTVTVGTPPVITVTPATVFNCVGGASTTLTAGGSAAGYTWDPGALTGNPVNVSPALFTTYTVTGVDANGCPGTNTANVIVTNPTGDLANATVANASSTPGLECNNVSHADGINLGYFDVNCKMIANVIDAVGGNVLGNVNTCVTVDASVQLVNGQPYLRRWYEITPTSNGPADVILYLTQDDFDDYNAAPAAAGWPPLPTAPLTNYANVRITKNDAGVLSVITPTIMWDAVNNRYALSFSVTGFSQFRVHSVNNTNAPLPVSYKMFTARKENTVDVLDWITGSEENNKQFNVERSANGEEFTRIGVVATKAPNGNSQVDINYTFVDEKPMTGHNYYRLAQEDIDGKINYSETIDLIWGANGSTITMYPNPTTEVLNVDINATMASNITIRVMDMSGRTVKTTEARTEQGVNNVKINLSDVSSGIYNVQLVENGKLIATERVNKK